MPGVFIPVRRCERFVLEADEKQIPRYARDDIRLA